MNCNICGERVTESIRVKNRSWDKLYHHCVNCDFIFIDDAYILKQEEEVKRYEMHNNSVEDPSYRAYFEKFISYIFDGIKVVGEVLDYGSGPEPVLATVLKSLGYKVDIYDKFFSPEKVYLNKKYDLVVSTEVFEHIWQPLPVINELVSCIKDGGYLAIMTNFHSAIQREFGDWWYIQDPTHIAFYSPKTFKYIGKKLNLEIVKSNNKNILVLKKRS